MAKVVFMIGAGGFPISRDPPEGGTLTARTTTGITAKFPISRDPPEGGTC